MEQEESNSSETTTEGQQGVLDQELNTRITSELLNSRLATMDKETLKRITLILISLPRIQRLAVISSMKGLLGNLGKKSSSLDEYEEGVDAISDLSESPVGHREDSSSDMKLHPFELQRLMGSLYEYKSPSQGATSLLSDYASAYVRLEQKYTQLLATLTSGQFPVLVTSEDKIMDREEPGSPLRLPFSSLSESTMVRIEVDEDPLTVEQTGMLFSTLSTLATKYWLISQGRYADLIEFSKSHDERFIREAQAVITRISYNSPLNFDIKLSATDVAQGITTTIDGIVQTGKRFKQMDLATKAKELELQQAEQRFAEELKRLQEQEAFEQEKRQLELAKQQVELERLRLGVDQQRLEVFEARLQAQSKSMDHAFEIAHKVIAQLHPQADDATKRMLVQTYVSDILQLSGISFTSVTVVEVDQASRVDDKDKDKEQ